ncbi:MAG: helicase SNF2, partial [Polaromonas sp.]
MKKSSSKSGVWFNPQSLKSLSSNWCYLAGVALYYSDSVLDMDISPMADGWLVEGTVLGDKKNTYEVSIEMTLSLSGEVAEWDSECTCRAGHQCEHGVALMFNAANEGLSLLAQDAPRTAIAPAPPPKQL